MAACTPGDNYDKDASDCTICPWNTDVGYCVFLNVPVSITDVRKAKRCVHLDYTQDAITSCEKSTSNKAFFPLQVTDFGHPIHEGLFPGCTNAAELLKRQVGMLPFRDAQEKEVKVTSPDVVNALCEDLQRQSHGRTKQVMEWSKQWHKDKLVEERSQPEINKHTLLITKCLGSGNQFKTFYQVR
jgi:hypothetical protein